MNLKKSPKIIQIITLLEAHNEIIFLHELPIHLRCALCKQLLKNAVQVRDCGCRYCYNCINNYVTSSADDANICSPFDSGVADSVKYCIGDQEECKNVILSLNSNDSNVYSDIAVDREIAGCKVRCFNSDCTDIMTLEELAINHQFQCTHRVAQCDQCSELVPIKSLPVHKKKYCLNRDYVCSFCSKVMSYQKYKKKHINVEAGYYELICKEWIDFCPLQCTVDKQRVVVSKHIYECRLRQVECPFNRVELGRCSKRVRLDELNKHLENDFVQHIELLIDKVTNMDIQIKSMQKPIDDLKEDNLKVKRLLINDENTKYLEESLISLKKPARPLWASIKYCFNSGNYLWVVKNFEFLKNQAIFGNDTSIISDAFYAADCSYKLCLKLYPNGDGVGLGKYLSIYFAILHGEYDDILPWPFKHKLQLCLLEPGGTGRTFSETFKADGVSPCYSKPSIFGGSINPGFGAPKFYQLKDLEKSGFLKNDTLYIKCSILS